MSGKCFDETGEIYNKKVKNKTNTVGKKTMWIIVFILIGIIAIFISLWIIKMNEYKRMAENSYNQAFYKLVEYTNDTEKLLAKSTISNSKEQAAKILSTAWKSATLAQTCISFLPVSANDLEQSEKFYNQVSDYCFYLSKKSINGEDLSEEDLSKLTELHEYSVSLVNTINQLESELYYNTIKWSDLTKRGTSNFKGEDDNLTQVSFSNIEEDLHQYTGLIYDGAFSENRNIFNGKGITGENFSIEEAKKKAIEFIGEDRIESISNGSELSVFNGHTKSENDHEDKNATEDNNSVETKNLENNNIECFKFDVTLKNGSTGEIILIKKGGHVLSFNSERNVSECNLSVEKACKIGRDFLESKEFKSMKETYFMSQGNILTINYAYYKEGVICYPDLVKVKVALDNGEILGVEAKNYLNNHEENRTFDKFKISKEDCLKHVNKKLEIKGIDKAIIPTEWNTEISCYEVKGNAYGNDFIIFINSETGKEEDILMVLNTEEGTMTM